MDFTELVGFIAGASTTFSFLPQVLKTWKTRHTKDLSLALLSLLLLGTLLWLYYGVMLQSFPVIIANFITFIFVFVLLCFKLRYK